MQEDPQPEGDVDCEAQKELGLDPTLKRLRSITPDLDDSLLGRLDRRIEFRREPLQSRISLPSEKADRMHLLKVSSYRH
jgi:hypothetical protein